MCVYIFCVCMHQCMFFLYRAGCMAERLKKQLLETDKMVDLVAGPGEGFSP